MSGRPAYTPGVDHEHPDNEDLHFWSFIDHAISRASRELPGVDPLAMRLVLTLHRAANMLVYDLESTVHRPRGWSWPGFRVLFAIWLSSPVEAKKVAELSGMSRAAVSALVNTLERDAITTAFQAHNEREREWAGSLSSDEQRTLISLLEKLTTRSLRFEDEQRM
jgi:hypothetical protein